MQEKRKARTRAIGCPCCDAKRPLSDQLADAAERGKALAEKAREKIAARSTLKCFCGEPADANGTCGPMGCLNSQ